MISLEGKVALVTGASRGIGAAVAHSLASHGVRLALASRSGDDLGIEDAVAAPCDVRRPDDLESLAAGTAERFGGIDILVANAGVGAYGPFLDLPTDQLEEMIDVNVKGTLYAVRATLPYLLTLASSGVETAVRADVGLAKGVNLSQGKVTCRGVAEAHGLRFDPLM